MQDHPDDNRKYIAKLAATDEPVEGLWIYKNGKHREVTAEEANTFRAEYLAAQQPAPVEEDHSYDIPDSTAEVAYTAPAFRGEDETEGTTGGLADTAPTVVGSTVEERLKALELAVFGTVREAA